MQAAVVLAVLVLFGGQPAANRTVGPTPRWTYPGSLSQNGTNDDSWFRFITATPTVVLLPDYRGSRIVALRRSTGEELWRRKASPSVVARDAPAGGVVTGGEGWRLIGAASDTPAGEVVVLASQRTRGIRDPQKPNGVRWETGSTLQAVEAVTGRMLWEETSPYSPQDDPESYPVGVHDGLLVVAEGERDIRTRFRNPATGEWISPSEQSGQDALRGAARRHGSPLMLLNLFWRPYLLNLETGVLSRIPVPPNYLYYYGSPSEPLLMMDGRVIAHIDTDDDGVGHSGWPKFLYCCDLKGRKYWTFPARFEYMDPDRMLAAHSSRIKRVLPVRQAGVVVAQDDGGCLYGVRVRDGKTLWRKRLPELYIADTAPLDTGILVLTQPREKPQHAAVDSSLAYVDGRSGKFRWLTRLPLSREIEVDGDDVFVLVAQQLCVYSLRQLLALDNGQRKRRRA